MQNSMGMLTFFVFGRKYSFWANLVQKIKIVSLRWNLIPILIRICRIQWCCSLFSFSTGSTLSGQFGPKSWNCQFNVKLDPYTNSNMQNSMVMFTFYIFSRKYHFWANLVQKIKIVSLRWNLILQYQDQKCPFWASLFQKIKIVSLSSNLVPKLIKICT